MFVSTCRVTKWKSSKYLVGTTHIRASAFHLTRIFWSKFRISFRLSFVSIILFRENIPLRACLSFHPACFQVRNKVAGTPKADSVHDCPSTIAEVRRCWRDRHRSTISSGRNYRDEGHDRYLSLLPCKMCKGRGWSKHRLATKNAEKNSSTLILESLSHAVWILHVTWKKNI